MQRSILQPIGLFILAALVVAGCARGPVHSIGGIDVEPPEATIGVGQEVELTAETFEVVGTPDTSVTWSSEDETVATVDDTGTVTGVAVGTTEIVATSNFDETVSGSATITVVDAAVTGIQVEPDEVTLTDDPGGTNTAQLEAVVDAVGEPDASVTWSSDDTSVATVSDTGLVTAVGPGTATITATSNFDETVSGTATVTVVSDELAFVADYPDETVNANEPMTDLEAEIVGGEAPYSFAVTDGALPPGVELDTDTGTISGTPTAGGTYEGTVTVTDAQGDTATATFTIVVTEPVAFTGNTTTYGEENLPLFDGTTTVGADPVNVPVGVTGGVPPYEFTIGDGEPASEFDEALPPGVTVTDQNDDGMVIAGDPEQGGFYRVLLEVTDQAGQSDVAVVELRIFEFHYSSAEYAYPIEVDEGTGGETFIQGQGETGDDVVLRGFVGPDFAFGWTLDEGASTGTAEDFATHFAIDPETGAVTKLLDGAVGTFVVEVAVEDSAGNTATTTLTLTPPS